MKPNTDLVRAASDERRHYGALMPTDSVNYSVPYVQFELCMSGDIDKSVHVIYGFN